ncbi:MAG: hydroxyacylglutathione hydrolase [Deltaproteobacteria bacterium]|nr:hydroxyacylglutathione hydrolase [Deltaproteobacteria bacterium]
MTHAVTSPPGPVTIAGGALTVHTLPAASDNLVWLLVAEDRGEAAVVDGPGAEEALAACEALGVRLTTVVNTHTHHDHIGVNKDLARRGRLEGLRVVGPRKVAGAVPGLTDPVDDGDTIEILGVEARVMLTEGHIDGHVSYVVGDALFCGDTLFAGGCGYLFDGPPAKMHASLARLAALPGDTRVFCAHEYTQDNLRFAWSVEPDNEALAERIRRVWATRAQGGATVPSTIAVERATNPFLRGDSEPLRRRVAEGMPGAPMGTPVEVFAATRALKDTKRYRERGDEGLPV